MTTDPATTILDSARYLRDVRPIDPTELAGYVSGQLSHDEVVSLIREHATEIGLIERPDGRFEAAQQSPLSIDFSPVQRLPPEISRTLEGELRAEYGDDWATGETGDELRSAIRRFKAAYFQREAVDYDRATALGYAIYHLPASFASVQYVLHDLGEAELLSGWLRVLDVGAGVGGQALGLSAYLPATTLVDYTAVESSDAACSVLGRFLDETGPNFRSEIRNSSIESATLEGTYDLILCTNVLNELERPTAVLRRLRSKLAPTGAIVAVEPADLHTSRGLRRIEREASRAGDLSIFSPTIRLWPGRQPTDDCWSFDVQPAIEVPRFQRALDEGARVREHHRQPATGEFVNVDVQYSYSILRRDDRRRIDYHPSRSIQIPLETAANHPTTRVDVAVVKLSHSLADEPDQNPLYVIGDGSQDEQWFAVETKFTQTNRLLEAADYGDILLIRQGLVLWNDDEEAYNLVVDDETIVDRVTPTGYQAA